ncbi:hypothetical protein [Streptomyces coeruleorubidus]|uniref:hypothetical protein n=1 Tax=Streptomyces coeruleorubidus TaxID=116188 RepID=UPI003647A7B3
MSVMSAGTEARPSRWRAGLGRLAAGVALPTAVALLPWLAGNDPALSYGPVPPARIRLRRGRLPFGSNWG